MRKTLLLVLLCAALLAPAAPGQPAADRAQAASAVSIENFQRVSAEVYRSSQPSAEQMKGVEAMGIRSVLNLREFHSDEEEVAGTSLKLYEIGMNAAEVTQLQIAEAVLVLSECPKPVLVHCWFGSDRTGLVIAVYRMVFQNWSKEQAMDDMINGGHGFHREYLPGFEKLLSELNVEKLKELASSSRGSAE